MTGIRAESTFDQRLRGRSVICVGTADWSTTLWTNQQHLMSRLARDNRVVFSESLGLRRPTVSGRDLKRMLRRVATGPRRPRLRDGVWVVSPLVLPVHGSRLARRLNRLILGFLLRRAARRAGLSRPILWAYNPHAHELLGAFEESLVVYHCVDDVAAQEGVDEDSFAAAERALVRRADLVLVSSEPLIERMRAQGAEAVEYLPNVADVSHFSAAEGMLEPAELRAIGRPRLLFAGAIAAKKLDVSLLAALARRRPEWAIVLVGPAGEGDPRGDLAPLLAEPNVHPVGRRPFAELPAWIGAADVCLIPYASNRYTASVFPMKVYEYLAAGRPVVSTPLPSLRSTTGVAFAEGVEAFEAAVERELAADSPSARVARRRLAESNSWERRLGEIGALVSACETRPLGGSGPS